MLKLNSQQGCLMLDFERKSDLATQKEFKNF